MIPGESFIEAGEVELNAGAPKRTLEVKNSGDRPVQVGSHAHFFEVNAALLFDRGQAYGFRLNVPSGTALRFEPGEAREVELRGGKRRPHRVRHERESERAARGASVVKISRERYATLYGPSKGDRLRLGDTNLILEVEKDYAIPGEEAVFGGGKTIRDGMAQSQRTRAEGAPDLVITNAVIVDYTGVYKADVGVRTAASRPSAKPATRTSRAA